MRTSPYHRLALAFVCALLIGCSAEPQFKSVKFGSFSRDEKRVTFEEQNLFIKTSETTIGWAFDIENSPKEISVREVLSGPEGTSWPADSGVITDNGRTVSVTTTFKNPSPTFLFHNWTIDHTDVVGNYKATLYIDGRLIKEVDFAISN